MIFSVNEVLILVHIRNIILAIDSCERTISSDKSFKPGLFMLGFPRLTPLVFLEYFVNSFLANVLLIPDS